MIGGESVAAVADPSTGRKWHYCLAEGGYIGTRLLKPATLAS